MTTYFKATRPNGTDFHTGRIDYAAALVSGGLIEHPRSYEFSDMRPNESGTYLSVSVEPGEALLGGRWPCRLFEVRPVGRLVRRTDGCYPHKRGCLALRVLHELPACWAFGPNGEVVAALIEAARSVTPGQVKFHAPPAAAANVDAFNAALNASRDASRDAAMFAAGIAAQDATRPAAQDATRIAAWDASLALLVRDLITPEQFDVLYGPWAEVMER